MKMELFEREWHAIDTQLTACGVSHLDRMTIVDNLLTASLIGKGNGRELSLDRVLNVDGGLVFTRVTGRVFGAEMAPVSRCGVTFIAPMGRLTGIRGRKEQCRSQ